MTQTAYTLISGTPPNALYRYSYSDQGPEEMTNAPKVTSTGLPYPIPRKEQALPAVSWDQMPSLKSLAKARGIGVGCAIPREAFGFGEWGDVRYRDAIAAECNLIGGNTQFKMNEIWSSYAQAYGDPAVAFQHADRVRAYADTHGMLMRGHVLAWHEPGALAPFYNQATVGTEPNMLGYLLSNGTNRPQAERFLRNWITATVGRYRGRMDSWDVINEVTEGTTTPQDQTGFRTDSIWYQAFNNSHDYIDLAFRIANEVDPSARLVWCEENLEHDEQWFEDRRNAVLRNLEKKVREGVPIHGLALQGHLSSLKQINQKQLRDFFRNVASLGLTLEVTEFDIDDRNFVRNETIRHQKVAELTTKFLDVVLDEPYMLNVMFWDMSNNDGNWLNSNAKRKRWNNDEKHLCLPLNGKDGNNYSRMQMWVGAAQAFNQAPNHKAIRDKLRGRVI
jgi:endo-1,4-beta-xylanase